MFTNEQLEAFKEQVEGDEEIKVHAVEEVGGLMLAHTEIGSVYSNGVRVCSVEGEQQQGEVFRDDELYGYYNLQGEQLVVTAVRYDEEKAYSNNDEGWAQMANDVLA